MSAPVPTAPCTPVWAEHIELCLGGEAEPSAWTALRDHLTACDACAAAYDQAGRLTALLAGGAATDLPPAAVADGERRLLAALAALPQAAPAPVAAAAAPAAPAAKVAAARPAAVVEPQVGKLLPFRPRVLVVGGALAAAAGLAVALRVPPPAPGPAAADSGFTARGGETSKKSVGFRAFCIDVSPPSPAVRSSAVADGQPARCVLGDRLQFTYSIEDTAPVHLSLWLVGHGQPPQRLWGDAAGGAVAGGVVDAVIRQTWPLETAGELTVYGVFGDGPPPTSLPGEGLARASGTALDGVGRVHALRLVVEAR